MTATREIQISILREALSYDAQSGVLTWLDRPVAHFEATAKRTAEHTANLVNSMCAGKRAGSITAEGYRVVTVCGVTVLEHRAAYAIVTGAWPEHEIDHLNGVLADNRWDNIRDVSRGKNAQNLPLRKDNRSGVVGVGWYARSKKWRARITVDRRTVLLGYFDSFEEACAAREQAQSNLGFHENHGRPAA